MLPDTNRRTSCHSMRGRICRVSAGHPGELKPVQTALDHGNQELAKNC